ncbi:hypothetical protein LguiA_033608 [Lonicera macranthoides]
MKAFRSRLAIPFPPLPSSTTRSCGYISNFNTKINNNNKIMMMSSNALPSSSSSNLPNKSAFGYHQIPESNSDEIDRISDQTLKRYSYNDNNSLVPRKRSGKGIAIVWFRNDLRVLDNEALFRAWISSEAVLPLYCFDPRLFGTTHYFGFPKTGALRAQFLIECLVDLKRNLMKRGLNLLIQHGKPEEILPKLVETYGVHTVKELQHFMFLSLATGDSEEVNVERLVNRNLQQVVLPSSRGLSKNPSSAKSSRPELIWGSSMYHIDDLPFNCSSLPDVYTQFRKSVESESRIRGCIKIPTSLAPAAGMEDWGCVPVIDQLGLQEEQAGQQGNEVHRGIPVQIVGKLVLELVVAIVINDSLLPWDCSSVGQSTALSWWKLRDFLWKYKETRSGMLGPDYSTKFSPWLASGSLSSRFIYEETSPSIIAAGQPLLELQQWVAGGGSRYPLVDANMKELSSTGFMSNRGRQIVCSFLVRDLGIDWRMGAEWFETCLLDYDPCSNYGNWTYGAEHEYIVGPLPKSLNFGERYLCSIHAPFCFCSKCSSVLFVSPRAIGRT